MFKNLFKSGKRSVYKYILFMTALLNMFFRVSQEEEMVKKVYHLHPR